MEMGTMEYALLQDKSIGLEEIDISTAGVTRTGAASTSATKICFRSRSGDEVMDGGHITVPSIGQDIPSSIKTAISCVAETSGKTHIVPITWQKAKKITNTMGCISTRFKSISSASTN